MAYDEDLADRVECSLRKADVSFETKHMMGGIAFLVDSKMCVGVEGTGLIARVGPEAYQDALAKPGAGEMDFTGRPMRGWVLVEGEELQRDTALGEWIRMALAFNPQAKRSKKKT